MISKEIGSVMIGVDMQNDFCPGGSLAVPHGDEVISPFNTMAEITRNQGGIVVFTRDWHPANTSHFDKWPPHCIADTQGADFHANLVVKANDLIISKGIGADEDGYSGFDGKTNAGETLESIILSEAYKHNKIAIFVGGLATDYCVKATVLDALKISHDLGDKSLGVIALRHCMRAVNLHPDDEEKALAEMREAGVLWGEPIGG